MGVLRRVVGGMPVPAAGPLSPLELAEQARHRRGRCLENQAYVGLAGRTTGPPELADQRGELAGQRDATRRRPRAPALQTKMQQPRGRRLPGEPVCGHEAEWITI